MSKKILVTGATGHFGGKVVDTLLQSVPADRLAVSVRDPQKAAPLRERGVDVRRGDFDEPASLDAAFAGVERLLIISTSADDDTRIRHQPAAVAAAARAGVQFIAYTSVVQADRNPLGLARVHRVTEEAIRETGIPFCFLRCNWYAENEASTLQAAAAGNPVLTAAGNGRAGWAARDDYAVAAAAVLAGSGHENTVYELSGPLRSYDDLAGVIGEVLGQEVGVHQVDLATYEEIVAGFGLPDFVQEMLVDIQRGIRAGALEVESDDLERLLGRPVTPLEETLGELARRMGVAAGGSAGA